MRVAQGMDEIAHLEPGHLRYHVGQQRVGRDVEGDAEEDICRALVELARQLSIGDIELEQCVARRQGHVRQIGHVPGADDVPTRIRIAPNRLDHFAQLVDVATIRRRPAAPLVTIDRSQVAVLVGPLVPDADAVVVQPADVGLAPKEPEQLAEDRTRVHLFGGDQRKTFPQIKPHLVAKHAQRAGTSAVTLFGASVADSLKQVQVLLVGVHTTFSLLVRCGHTLHIVYIVIPITLIVESATL